TESTAMAEHARVEPQLRHLHEAGFTLAIDDFGAGHSSLARLRDLPVDMLKVDRSFLAATPHDPQASAIVGAVLALANGLGMTTVAEGVETEAQHRFLRDAGCPLAQGFHLGRPVPLAALAPALDITGVDVVERPDYPGPFVRADATERLPFEDGAFDLAYSNSVIEHLPVERRAAFARELRRVARGWWVQTPAFSFPVEPHALLPFAHWLPARARRAYWRLGAAGSWEEIALVRR